MQKRFYEYKAPLVSADDNIKDLGQLFPGRFCGFDTVVYPGSGDQFTLSHANTGIITVQTNGTPTARTGVAVTKQGVVVREDAAIGPFTLATQENNGSARIDLIIMRHQYILSAGGQVATYEIITGPLGSNTLPTIPSPNTATIIAYIYLENIDAGGDEILGNSNYKYVPARTPDVGNVITLRDEYTKLKHRLDFADAVDMVLFEITSGNFTMFLSELSNNYIHPEMGGSSFTVNCIERPIGSKEGTTITMALKQATSAEMEILELGTTPPAGQARIIVPINFRNLGNGISLGLGLDMVELTYRAGPDRWVVTNVILSNTNPNRFITEDKGYPYASAQLSPILNPTNATSFDKYTTNGNALINFRTNTGSGQPKSMALADSNRAIRVAVNGVYRLDSFFKIAGLIYTAAQGRFLGGFHSNTNPNLDATQGTPSIDNRGLYGGEVFTQTWVEELTAGDLISLRFILYNSVNFPQQGTINGQLILTKIG